MDQLVHSVELFASLALEPVVGQPQMGLAILALGRDVAVGWSRTLWMVQLVLGHTQPFPWGTFLNRSCACDLDHQLLKNVSAVALQVSTNGVRQ